MTRFVLLLFIVLALVMLMVSVLPKSADQDINPNQVFIATSIHPMALLVQELAPAERSVFSLVPAGQSPHTYSPKPSDGRRCKQALALICVAPSLDAWSARVPVAKRIHALSLLPMDQRLLLQADGCSISGHDHEHHRFDDPVIDELSIIDPHFWLDPYLVAEIVEPLAIQLAQIDPDYADHYQTRAQVLKAQYMAYGQDLLRQADNLKGKALIQFHPSMAYFLKRFGMIDAGVVTAQVSSSPTPKALESLINKSKQFNLLAVCTEPQLPQQAAERIAEHLNKPLVSVDPLGAQAKNMQAMWQDILDALLVVDGSVAAP
jgi:zinc transport system substrate-binding protein